MKKQRKFPRSLRKQPNKARIKRRNRAAKALRSIRSDPLYYRERGYFAVMGLFLEAGLRPPTEVIEKVFKRKGSCRILELGSGQGFALSELRGKLPQDWLPKIVFEGIDILPVSDKRLNPPKGVLLHSGDILARPFPKSDIIFSIWALGYVGNIGFTVRKTSDALNSGGIAVLHINRHSSTHLNDAKPLVQDLKKLASNLSRIKLKDAGIQVNKALRSDNLIVVIRKE